MKYSLVGFSVLVSFSCAGVAFAASSHLQYFGYFGSNFIGDDAPLTASETADHTNIIWVYEGAANWQAQMKEAIQLGQKIVLDVLPIFYDDSSHSRDQLRPDYQARWQSLVGALTPEMVSHLAAFYHVDELAPDISDITVTWSGLAAPTSLDWVGMYPLGAGDSNYVSRLYVGSASCSRSAGGASGSCVFRAPSSAGVYEFRLFTHDTLTKLGLSNSVDIEEVSNPGFSSSVPPPTNGVTLSAAPTSVGFVGARTRAVRTVNALIKNSFPAIPIATVFGGGYDLRPEQVSSGFDWVAFDCYGDFYTCQIPERVATLKSMMNANQRMMLIPEGNSFTTGESSLVERINLFYNLALTEPQVVALFPIGWSNYMEGTTRVLGTKSLPLVKERYKQIGQEITGKHALVSLHSSSGPFVPGQSIKVEWSGRTSPNAYDWVALYPPGASDSGYVSRLYVGSASCTKVMGGVSGSCNFPAPSAGGAYEFRMFDADTLHKIAVSETLTVKLPPPPPSSGGSAGGSSGGPSGGGASVTNPAVQPPLVNYFMRNLNVGMRGEDVKRLQQFLNAKGFIIASAGPGSPGFETDYFGALTGRAVIRFQEFYRAAILAPNGLTRGTGFVGYSTRKFIQEMK